jgi:tetratricopeptide (TPR) repeat protein/DNA-binding CsgD family transcriptional regulator
MKNFVLTFAFFLSILSVFSQSSETDSLFNLLRTLKEDSSKVKILNDISYQLLKSDFQKSFQYADSALYIAKDISYKKGIALSYTHLSYSSLRMGKPDDALIYINKSLAIYELLEDKIHTAKNLSTIAQIYYTIKDYDKASEYTQKSIDLKTSNKLLNDLEINYMTLGVIEIEKADYKLALEHFFKSIEYCEINKNPKNIAGNYNNIAIVYRKMNDDIAAIDFYKKSLNIYSKLNDKHGQLKIYNNLAVIYEKNKNISKAKEYYNIALNLSREMNYSKGIANSLTNLGGISVTEKNFRKAKTYLSDAENIYTKMDDVYGLINVFLLKGQLFYESGQFSIATEHTKKAIELLEGKGLLQLKSDAFLQLSIIYEARADYKNSLVYFKTYHLLNDSIFNIEQTSVTEDIKRKYNTDTKEKELTIKNQEINLLQKEKKIGNLFNYILAAGIIILIAIIFLLILIYKIKYRRKVELNRNRLQIAEKENKILELDIQSKQIKAKQLKEEIEYKNRELQNFAHYIVEKNDFILKILNDLKALNFQKPEKDKLQSIIVDINNLIISEKDKEEFFAHVDQIYSNFYLRLKEKYPNISESEQRLSSLLKIGLSSKDIASILHISPKSVDTSRYRLRKKLELKQEDSLVDFLNNFH